VKKLTILFLNTLFIASGAFSQVYTNKDVGKKNKALIDSLKKAEWPYVFPITGKKATQRGFDLPYSAGVSMQYFGQQSDIIIDNLMVGFNNSEIF
jgi:hypothetical protein